MKRQQLQNELWKNKKSPKAWKKNNREVEKVLRRRAIMWSVGRSYVFIYIHSLCTATGCF